MHIHIQSNDLFSSSFTKLECLSNVNTVKMALCVYKYVYSSEVHLESHGIWQINWSRLYHSPCLAIVSPICLC